MGGDDDDKPKPKDGEEVERLLVIGYNPPTQAGGIRREEAIRVTRSPEVGEGAVQRQRGWQDPEMRKGEVQQGAEAKSKSYKRKADSRGRVGGGNRKEG